MREKVFAQNTFDEEAIIVLDIAGKHAIQQKEKKVLCSHVFVACAQHNPDVIHTLLGREITKLPSKYKINSERKFNRISANQIDFAPELSSIFLDTAPGTPLQLFKAYQPGRPIGVRELAFAIIMEPTEEIGDILLANDFTNDATTLENLLRENYLRNIRSFSSVPPRKRMLDMVNQSEKFEKYMTSHVVGQRKAIKELATSFTNFWYNGNNTLPYVVLLLSKTGGGRSYFADTMQRAFVELSLQSKVEPPLDLSGFLHDSSCEADLLGDSKSFRNARSGKLYKMMNSNRRGMLVFEDILAGSRNAKGILRSFSSNLAYDKFFEENMLLPFNIIVFTMKITDDQYRFIMDKNSREIDSKLMNELFLSKNMKTQSKNDENAASDTAGLWQRADKIVLLEQLSEDELHKMLMDKFTKLKSTLDKDYGIELKFNDMERLMNMILLSAPKEFTPRELIDAFNEAIDEKIFWQTICSNHEITKVKINCPELPEYQHDLDRRIIRGDYLSFKLNNEISKNTLTLSFSDLCYKQQERIDCTDYRIERPKGISIEDIVGLDDVWDELLDALAYITNRDTFNGKAPAPSKNFILYGPPGTGKTSLAVALANKADIPVFFATSSIFADSKKLADMFRKANEMAPAIVVLEEFNSIGDSTITWRRDSINELLAIFDGVQSENNVMVIASTNHIEQIEESLLRSGRFGRRIRIDYPTFEARVAFIHSFEKKYGFELTGDVLNDFVEKTENISIADIKGILGYALRGCVRTNKPIDSDCLNAALEKFRKSNTKTEIGFIGGNER